MKLHRILSLQRSHVRNICPTSSRSRGGINEKLCTVLVQSYLYNLIELYKKKEKEKKKNPNKKKTTPTKKTPKKPQNKPNKAQRTQFWLRRKTVWISHIQPPHTHAHTVQLLKMCINSSLICRTTRKCNREEQARVFSVDLFGNLKTPRQQRRG